MQHWFFRFLANGLEPVVQENLAGFFGVDRAEECQALVEELSLATDLDANRVRILIVHGEHQVIPLEEARDVAASLGSGRAVVAP